MISKPLNKRSPEMADELLSRYAKMSKADWADLYFDLYRQCFGETLPDEECMKDAERRLDTLKTYRQKEAK